MIQCKTLNYDQMAIVIDVSRIRKKWHKDFKSPKLSLKLIEKYFLDLREMFSNQDNIRKSFLKHENSTQIKTYLKTTTIFLQQENFS